MRLSACDVAGWKARVGRMARGLASGCQLRPRFIPAGFTVSRGCHRAVGGGDSATRRRGLRCAHDAHLGRDPPPELFVRAGGDTTHAAEAGPRDPSLGGRAPPPPSPPAYGTRTRVQSIVLPSAARPSVPPLARPSTPPLRSGVLRFAPPLRVTAAQPGEAGLTGLITVGDVRSRTRSPHARAFAATRAPSHCGKSGFPLGRFLESSCGVGGQPVPGPQ